MNTMLIYCAVLCVLWVVTCIYVLKVKGKTALVGLIEKAEFIFDWKGAGQEKLKYVLVEAQKVVPAPFKWFLTVDAVNRLVASLQDKFKEDKEIRNQYK